MKPVLVFRNAELESLGTIEDAFRTAGVPCAYVDLYDSLPRTFDPGQLSGIVVLGGLMNVDETDKYPYLAAELDYIRSALDAELPILGVCLGAQLLAKALGAKVSPLVTKEIGWYPLRVTEAATDDPLFSHFGPSETVFQWHGDAFELPTGAVQLAESPLCPQQAFRYGESAYGLQFHMEVTAEMVADWLAEPAGCAEVSRLDYIDPEEIRRRVPVEIPGMHALGERLFGRFAELCLRRM